MTELALTQTANISEIIKLVTDGLDSTHSRRAYEKALDEFMNWYQLAGAPGLRRATVQKYKKYLQDLNLSSATINQRLSAIRKLAKEAAANEYIEDNIASGIKSVEGVKSKGQRMGNWLSKDQAQQLLQAPDTATLKGLRDKAILAMFLFSGLRRSELAALTMEHIQQREGRWVIVDMVGKGGKCRTVPLNAKSKAVLDTWTEAAGITQGRVFKAINKSDNLAGTREIRKGIESTGYMTDQSLANVVTYYCDKCGFQNVAAHDLRRTYAKLARKSGARIEQIQITLGHASPDTTNRYLGTTLDLADSPSDLIDLDI
jgi:site-specific recombinase XerD